MCLPRKKSVIITLKFNFRKTGLCCCPSSSSSSEDGDGLRIIIISMFVFAVAVTVALIFQIVSGERIGFLMSAHTRY